jgi:hypothetical protein
MSKKNKSKPVNLYAEDYDRKENEFLYARLSVISRTEDVIMKKLAVELYPESPDKCEAQRELEVAQRRLINCIGSMDARRQELIAYYTENFDKIDGENRRDPNDYGTSHKVVECTVFNFYKNR